MKKIIKEYFGKTPDALKKEVSLIQEQIKKMRVERLVKPEKDSNKIAKLKKQLAVLLTVSRQQELAVKK